LSDYDPQRTWHFSQLRRSLQRLAAAGSGQPALFPEFASKPDELALEFDHWSSFVRSTYAGTLSGEQDDALAAICRKLATISRDGAEFDVDLWTEAALEASAHWAEVRALAGDALRCFGAADPASNPVD
jgi:hypothetical protein